MLHKSAEVRSKQSVHTRMKKRVPMSYSVPTKYVEYVRPIMLTHIKASTSGDAYAKIHQHYAYAVKQSMCGKTCVLKVWPQLPYPERDKTALIETKSVLTTGKVHGEEHQDDDDEDPATGDAARGLRRHPGWRREARLHHREGKRRILQ